MRERDRERKQSVYLRRYFWPGIQAVIVHSYDIEAPWLGSVRLIIKHHSNRKQEIDGQSYKRSTIVDLSKPPKGTLPQGYAYVSLSRSRAEKEITILREFDVSVLQTPIKTALLEEEKRLQKLHLKTLPKQCSQADLTPKSNKNSHSNVR